jgi:hypothetical protein
MLAKLADSPWLIEENPADDKTTCGMLLSSLKYLEYTTCRDAHARPALTRMGRPHLRCSGLAFATWMDLRLITTAC